MNPAPGKTLISYHVVMEEGSVLELQLIREEFHTGGIRKWCSNKWVELTGSLVREVEPNWPILEWIEGKSDLLSRGVLVETLSVYGYSSHVKFGERVKDRVPVRFLLPAYEWMEGPQLAHQN
jgi:hypothetical protein